MENELTNSVSAVGNYNSVSTSITSNASIVTMVEGLSINKSADKKVWADDNPLKYTITLNNEAPNVFEAPTITDILDSLITFVPDSVTIDGVSAQSSEYDFNDSTNTLTINLTNVDPNSEKIVTFKVNKKT